LKRLFTPSFIAETLSARHLSLRSRHGQNFLISRNVAERILEHAALRTGDTVLEIGPGLGQLTFLLAERVKKVIAVEIDGGVARYLRDTVSALGLRNVTIVDGDFLDGDFSGSGARSVVSNFPYGIAIKAVLKILRELRGVTGITGMVQREIADRMTAKPDSKDYAAVSVVLQFLAEARVLERHIAPGNFFPVPEVTSAVISVRRRVAKGRVDAGLFERVVKAGFSRRRKTLFGNLVKAGILPGADGPGAAHRVRNEVGDFISRRFRNAKVRAESLSVDDFVEVARIVGRSGRIFGLRLERQGNGPE
jgi:16S rRNA (adenine1518-N6/adenine1519-N6)-dimethyltransferase